MPCKQCGECCRWIALYVHQAGDLWKEYYEKRGAIFTGHELLIPSQCPHLKLRVVGDANIGGVLSEFEYYCDIYQTRPRLCHYGSQGKSFWKPEGCTNEME